jgi:MFS family permease
MLADLIEKEKRTEAYALMRMSNNAGISIGPAAGGFLAATSYNFAFIGAATGMSIYGILMGLLGRETLSVNTDTTQSKESLLAGLAGYRKIFTDWPFISTVGSLAFGWVTATLMWIIMPVYANSNFGIPENLYGLIPTTNAIMVVALQVLMTRFTRNYRPLIVMAIGMFFYAIANGSVALASSFWGFWTCMIILTIGELIIVPTSSTYVANIAPADMRGRYMSIYGLTWSFGSGVGPILGGLLNDNLGPRFIWVGGMTVGLLSTLALLTIASRTIDSRLLKENPAQPA